MNFFNGLVEANLMNMRGVRIDCRVRRGRK